MKGEGGPAPKDSVFVGLGSNLGDRLGYLEGALRGMSEGGIERVTVSSIYETPPLGYLEQPPFLNVVARGRWEGSPGGLLELLRGLEEEAGRTRSFSNAPRTLDLDIIFFGDQFVREPGITVPHPRWRGRSFVVHPLAEIVPAFRDPETGWRMDEIARFWPLDPAEIRRIAGPDFFRTAKR